ncbi:MAG TPA: helix-turn-helix domain-containing protein [Ktedonobacterales bacterium]|jgi:transposase
MEISLIEQEAADLARATATAHQVRQWQHYRAIQLLAEGQSPQQVVTMLGCSLASVYNRAASWQQKGHVGLVEARHAGQTHPSDASAELLLEQ